MSEISSNPEQPQGGAKIIQVNGGEVKDHLSQINFLTTFLIRSPPSLIY